MPSSFPEHSGALMSEERHGHRIRFVTLCQQLLTLAVVVAVLTPAARTVTMEVRPAQPGGGATPQVALRSAEFASKVPAAPVDPEVDQYALTRPEAPAKVAAGVRARVAADATARVAADGEREIVSDVVPVDGYGTVGVTWAHGQNLDPGAIDVEVRSKTDGRWSDWGPAEYHDDHGPDPKSAEARHARPGTDPVIVGDVDAVQVRVDTTVTAPADMKLAVISPGTPASTTTQKPAIDTAKLASAGAQSPAPAPNGGTSTGGTPSGTDSTGTTGDPTGVDGSDPGTTEEPPGDGTDGGIQLQAGVTTPRPKIYSRAQWGADERIREQKAPSYYEVHGGFVHHTVNANNYTAAQVPGIIRSIYSYHVRTRGWSDIGYNFLVDRFGRIWEGRAGGVDRPVVGAHTEGYNNYSFGAAAIGNFETVRPSSAVLNAYGALFAWKLSLHGVDAGSKAQRIGSRTFPAISGHRDTKSTACPGKYLYAQIPTIRRLADAAQRGWAGRELRGDYVGGSTPDIIARRASDKHLVVLGVGLTSGRWAVRAQVDSGWSVSWASQLIKAGDWDGDGYNDVIGRRSSDGALLLMRGRGGGKFSAPVMLTNRLRAATLLAVPGDVTGDGYPDLMGQLDGKVRIWPGRGRIGLGTTTNTLTISYSAYPALRGTSIVPAGLVDADGAPDILLRGGTVIRRYLGNGPGGLTTAQPLDVRTTGYDWLLPMGRVGANAMSDFVARKPATSELVLLPGNAKGWGTPISLGRFPGYDLGA